MTNTSMLKILKGEEIRAGMCIREKSAKRFHRVVEIVGMRDGKIVLSVEVNPYESDYFSGTHYEHLIEPSAEIEIHRDWVCT